MIHLKASVRVVIVCPAVCDFFCFPVNQLFELEVDTIFFAGDYVILDHDGHTLFGLAGPEFFQTTKGQLSRNECRVIARAVPIESQKQESPHA